MIQTCLSRSYGVHLDLVRPAPARIRRTSSRGAASPAPSCRCDRRRTRSGASGAPTRASRPVRRSRSGRRCCRWRCARRLQQRYGVHGFASAGSGSSPRCAIQMRSGVSAYTAPTDPHVQPACLTPSAPSGSGCGQFGDELVGSELFLSAFFLREVCAARPMNTADTKSPAANNTVNDARRAHTQAPFAVSGWRAATQSGPHSTAIGSAW